MCGGRSTALDFLSRPAVPSRARAGCFSHLGQLRSFGVGEQLRAPEGTKLTEGTDDRSRRRDRGLHRRRMLGKAAPSPDMDGQAAIKVVDGTVEVVSEGQWKLARIAAVSQRSAWRSTWCNIER